MTIQELERLVEQLSQTSGKKQAEIFQDLADFAQIKYGNNISDNERMIIDTVKEKLLNGLYKMADNSYVKSRPDYGSEFGLDRLELNVLEKAGNELERADLLEGGTNYIKLTDKGVLEAKKLRGDL
jgi:hypothetical protein